MKISLHLSKLALIALAGTLVCCCEKPSKPIDNNDQSKADVILTEDEFFAGLNDKEKALYQSLDKEGQELALQIATQSTSGSASSNDKNTAVRIAAKQMSERTSTDISSDTNSTNSTNSTTTWTTSWSATSTE